MGGESGLGDLARDEALSRPDTAPPPPIPPSEREEATVDVNVWSLNQFYPFSFFSITAKKVIYIFSNTQSRSASALLIGVLGPPTPSAAYAIVS